MAIPQIEELQLLHENICKAVGDPRRIQLLYAIHEGRQHVSALAEALSIPQPTVSRHLAMLRQRGLVVADRDGSAVYYRLADDRLITILDTMRQIMREMFDRKATMLDQPEGEEATSLLSAAR